MIKETENIRIREMQFDDIDFIVNIEKANFSTPWSANGFFTYLIREDTKFLVASYEETVVGYCGTILISPESEITNICVDEPYRGKGIASLLLHTLKSDLKSLGIDTIHLEVRTSNAKAIALYEKEHFTTVGKRPAYYTDPDEDALLMTCNL